MVVVEHADPASPRALAGAAGSFALHKRKTNDLIRQGLGSGSVTAIPFLCECGASGCFRTVWLSPGDYDGRTAASSGALLAPAHA